MQYFLGYFLATFYDHFLATFGEQFGYKFFLHLATLAGRLSSGMSCECGCTAWL